MFPAAHASLIETVNANDLASLLAEAGEAVVYVDQNWTVQFCNDVYLNNVGMLKHDVIGRTPFEFQPQFKRSIFFELFEKCRTKRKPQTRIGFSTALNRWLLIRVFPVGSGMLAMANDASESIVKQYQLAQKIVMDPLTGLGNKLAMEQQINGLIKRDTAFSIALLGLDRFKEVNDAHGYATGDMALLEVVSAVQSATVVGETLYRFSGDEFAVVNETQTSQTTDITARAEALTEAVTRPILLNDTRVVLGASAGTIDCPRNGDDFELIVKRAGLALREAKKTGRDAVTAYKPEMELATQLRAELEGELRTAIDGNQFTLMIQPKVSLSTGHVVGGEALIRWAHPKRGMLAPGAFLGIAQEIGAMVSLDQWVLKQTLRYITDLEAQGRSIPLSMNLSVDSLNDMYLADRIAKALSDAKVNPSLLEVEIPEGALMFDVKISSKVLNELHGMGVTISIDDFGTGYSSFAYLAQFPVHVLKIDRSFIKDMHLGEANKKIVRGMIRLAHSLSLEVIAEGAETEDQLTQLKRMKCDSVQGYVMAKPMPFKDFVSFAQTSFEMNTRPSAFTI
jgi:diguanylate cyclase